MSERVHDTDRLVFGSDGEGTGGTLEIVVEILIRGVGGPNRRRRAERVLEGWSCVKAAPCEMAALESLKSLWPKKTADEVRSYTLPFFCLSHISNRFCPTRLRPIQPKVYLSTSTLQPPNNNHGHKYPSHMRTRVKPCYTRPLHLVHSSFTIGKQLINVASSIFYDPDSADDIDDDDPDEDLDI